MEGSGDGGLPGGSQQQDLNGVLEQGQDGDEDEYGYEEGADGVSDEQAKALNEDGGDDDAHTAHGVCQDVQEHPLHVGIVGVASVGVGVVSAEGCYADEVDNKPCHGDKEQSLSADVGRVQQTSYSLAEHKTGDHHQEHAVDETTEHLHTPIAVGVESRGLPARHERCMQTHQQRRGVKQHVEAVGDEPQAVGPRPVRQLHKREGLRVGRWNTATRKYTSRWVH